MGRAYMAKGPVIRSFLLALLRGAALIAGVTVLCYWTRLNIASTALLFLITLVMHSLTCTFAEAAAVSVLATASLDYFFMEPLFSFYVTKALDAVTLGCLVATTLVITRLQARARAEASTSKRQREIMARLYNVSQQLIELEPGKAFASAMLKSVLKEFDLKAVCLFDAAALESYEEGSSSKKLTGRTRDAYVSGKDLNDREQDLTIRCLRVRGSLAGAIGFEGLREPDLTAPALAALAATAMERARAFQSAASAAAQAHAEMLRSAILDALAHEIKTPLATILTAAGGMRTTGKMQPQQSELADLIEGEAARLGDLTSRLLRMARLDSEEIRPRMDRFSMSHLAGTSVHRFGRAWPDRRIHYTLNGSDGEVLADPELTLLALSQLLENACRYSSPDAGIIVQSEAQGSTASITVQNEGTPIPVTEQNHIFERFYRGTNARKHAPGTGLGLYVARKIALAHGGDITLVDAGPHAVAFRLSLPLAQSEASTSD
jgi:two-component system sensor histidine kinase KdpD